MITILYNISTKELISNPIINGYYVDGLKPILPTNIVELVVEDHPPVLNSDEILMNRWVIDLTRYEYRNEYTIEKYIDTIIEDDETFK